MRAQVLRAGIKENNPLKTNTHLTEGGSINLDDAVLHQGVGAHQLVVGGVVHDTKDTGLAGDRLGAPREVAGFQTKGTELLVATHAAHSVNALGSDLGHSRGATKFELALLAQRHAVPAGLAALMPAVP